MLLSHFLCVIRHDAQNLFERPAVFVGVIPVPSFSTHGWGDECCILLSGIIVAHLLLRRRSLPSLLNTYPVRTKPWWRQPVVRLAHGRTVANLAFNVYRQN